MPIDERELRSRLAESAALAGPPRLSTADLAARVRRTRRRRRMRAGIIAAVSAVAAASAVVIPLTAGGTGQPAISSGPAPPAPGLTYTLTVNGQAREVPARGAEPLFTVTPGERLTMTVVVTVPEPRAMTGLWLGITSGVLSGHATMEPVLAARTRVPLRPGAHRFVLRWTVPAGLAPGASRQLSAEWAWRGTEPGNADREVAYFAVPLPSGASTPAAVAHRLRAMALRAVTACDGTGPVWIHAVRTTFSKAMTAVGGGDDIADTATGAVYLVVMKGDFAFRDAGPVLPSCTHGGPTGHYFTAVFDAATFMSLEAGLGNHPPAVPLPSLGPLLNLR